MGAKVTGQRVAASGLKPLATTRTTVSLGLSMICGESCTIAAKAQLT